MKRQLTFGTRQIQFQEVICFKLIGLITHLINKEGQLFEDEEKNVTNKCLPAGQVIFICLQVLQILYLKL